MKRVADLLQREGSVLLLLGGLVLLDRLLLLLAFGFRYVGSDDLILWQGATDYAQGIFHEPYFYGQAYNFMLEALLAVPLVAAGVPHHIALPTITSLLALFPFFLFAWVLYRHEHGPAAAIFLLVPLLLPVEYGILTTIPRGFVTGLFFAGFLVYPLMEPHRTRSYVILGLACSFGYVFNPNSLIFALPIAVFLLLRNLKRPRFYLITALSAGPALLIQEAARAFYADRPDYNVHFMWTLEFYPSELLPGLARLDRYFSHLTPVVWSVGWLFLPALVVISVVIWRKDRSMAAAMLVATLFLIALLGVNKVNDDAGTLFLSSVRMFLGVPLFFALALSWAVRQGRPPGHHWKILVLVLGLCFVPVKAALYGPIAGACAMKARNGPIAVWPIAELRTECGRTATLLEKHDVDLLMLVPYWDVTVPNMEFYNYGCPLLETSFPTTLMNVYERRTWVFMREPQAVHPNILIFGRPLDLAPLLCLPGLKFEQLEANKLLITDNHYPLKSLLDALRVDLDRNSY